MLQWWEAVLLGSVQGFTEFLPISSSGHLVLVESLLGVTSVGLSFDIFVHVGTLVAVVFFFGRNLFPLLRKYWWQIIVATLPALAFGLVFADWIESIRLDMPIMALSYVWNAMLLLVAAVLLPTTESQTHSLQRFKTFLDIPGKKSLHRFLHRVQTFFGVQPEDSVSPLQALLVGIFQALAIIPGISRSASTVSAGIVVGMTRETAFSFAFLISIPAVFAAIAYDGVRSLSSGQAAQIDWFTYLLAIVASAVTGYVALALLRWLMKQGQLLIFAGYCLIVSVLIVLFA